MDSRFDDFRLQLLRTLNDADGVSSEACGMVTAMSQCLEREGDLSPRTVQSNPLSDILLQVKGNYQSLPVGLHPLVGSFFNIADYLAWHKRPAPDMPDFMAGHANAEIIGPRGLERRDDLVVGVTLMRPGITYPDHQHPPEELYIVLSEGLWRQNDNRWSSPGPGGYVYNPADIVHSMRSVESPLFALWCLKL
ncbi:dimethylsulfonioproprionate lyase family protein [Amphritea sp.]|uniref:dimethylsulfonioproprionate lyase family protein n=1 Tax=Amphritea sp. TaxID=1872502 RepID=UPI003D0F55C2